MMKVSKVIDLDKEDIFDGKLMSIGIDSNISKMYIGSASGYLRQFDILGNIPKMEKELLLNNEGYSIPFV